MDQGTKKIRDNFKAFYPRDDKDTQYVSRKEGRRGLTTIQDSDAASKKRVKNYIIKLERRLISVIRNNSDNTSINRKETTQNNVKDHNTLDTSSVKQARKLRLG